MRVLDWRKSPDPRNAQYRFSATPMCANLRVRPSVQRTKRVWLDQGQEGACTGFGAEHARALSPYRQATTDMRAREVYRRAQIEDEWPGEAYEGSSVNGAMKAERALGYITEWKWATTTTEAMHGLSYHGAGEIGTIWYDGMWQPDADGFLHPTGTPIGGHAYAISGFGVHNGVAAFRMENSWGKSWGDNGGAWISAFDFASLLADGELAFPKKVRL